MKSRISMLASIAALSVTSPSLAQVSTGAAPRNGSLPADAATSEADIRPGDIVVTGMRRESTVQNTAATIAVISADAMAKSGVQGSMSLQFQTPGVVISQDLGLQTQVYIRGIGSNLQGIAVSNSVATYLDGVYLPNTIQSAQTFNDIERVEVLKGPQATLYGRNATGGAINIITQRPTFEFKGKADVSYGNYQDKQLHVSMGGPLVDEKLAVSFAMQATDHKGYVENLFLHKDILAQTVIGLRAALLFTPSDDVSIIVRADNTYVLASDYIKFYGLVGDPRLGALYVGQEQYFDPRPRKTNYNIDPREPLRDRGVSATLEWDTGIGKVTSITSYRKFLAGPIYSDNDQVPFPPTLFPAGAGAIGTKFGSKSFYQEAYLSTDASKPLSAIIGGNYFDENAFELKRIIGASLAAPVTYTDRFGTNKAYAFYIDGAFRLSDQINIVGGIRYTHEDRDYSLFRLVPAGASSANASSFKNWSPRIGVEFRPRQGLLFYATMTTGFKSGGFNTDTPTNDFGPEKITSYEAGVKTTLFDILRFSASGFYYDYTDLQVLQYLTINTVTTPIITNAGTARLWGSDITADLRATDQFTIGAGVSLLHSEFGSAVFCDPLFGSCTATNPADRPFFNVKGNILPRAPKITGNIYADYTIPLDHGSVNIHADGAYRGKTYYTVFENPLYRAPDFWLFNTNVRYTSEAKGWFAEVYSQNITNKLAITQIINSSPVRNPATGVITGGTPARHERYSPPRTYGVRVGIKF